MLVITEKNFKKVVLENPRPVLVEIEADWSGSCHIMAPILKKLSSIYNGKVIIGRLNIETDKNLAREFGVSLDAIVYRISSLLKIKKEDTEQYLIAAKHLAKLHKPRKSDEPEILPQRYYDLAQRALRDGRLSLMQFAKYMGIGYKKAQEYLTDDKDFTDEKISIPVA